MPAVATSQLRRNPALICAYHGAQMSLFPIAVLTIFWKTKIGMSMTEIMVLQGFFGAVLAAFEFPSGYVGDRLGYRRTLMLAAAIGVIGWVVYSFSTTMVQIAVAEALLAISFSLASGCDSALLYESLLERGHEREFARWFGRYKFWGQISEGCAALAAGVLYAFHDRAPFMLQAVVWAVNIGLAAYMVEPARRAPVEIGVLRKFGQLIVYAARDTPALRATILLGLCFGLASFVPVCLIQSYAVDAGIQTTWLGPIWAVANFSVALAALMSSRVADRIGVHALLAGCVALVAIGYGGLATSYAWWGFAFYFVLTIMRGFNGPILQHVQQRLIPSADRAALGSLGSALFRAGFLCIAPFIGIAVDAHGQHTVLAYCGAGFAGCGVLGLWAFVRSKAAASS